jgi:hypothetical protein
MRILSFLGRELRHALAPTLFFLLCFNLLVPTVEPMTDRPPSA